MNIIATCKMGPGTFEAKFTPLSLINEIDKIYVLRKFKGPKIPKVHYILLPKICNYRFFEIALSPFLLAFYAMKVKAQIILSYHVIPYAFYAFIASIISGKPFIVAQTGLYIQTYAKRKFFKFWINLVLRNAKYLFVPGNISKEFWLKFGMPKSKIQILHSTIDTSYFKSHSVEKKFDFIFLGRLAKEKNLLLIINSFNKLKQKGYSFKLAIVGKGKQDIELRELVEELQLSSEIEFFGFQKDVLKWLNISKVFLMASYSEGLPTALMQAMACELVCISSRVGNIPDLLTRDTGFLFESGNEEELLELLEMVVERNYEFEKQSLIARQLVIDNHSHESATKRWATVFENLYLI